MDALNTTKRRDESASAMRRAAGSYLYYSCRVSRTPGTHRDHSVTEMRSVFIGAAASAECLGAIREDITLLRNVRRQQRSVWISGVGEYLGTPETRLNVCTEWKLI